MNNLSVWKVAGIVVLVSVLLIALFTLTGFGISLVDFIASLGTLALFVLVLSGGFQVVKKLFG
jgi:hypothetical protein